MSALATLSLFMCFALYRLVHTLLGWNQIGFISTCLGAKFFLRGAVISVFMAMVIEFEGFTALRPNTNEWRDVPLSLIVGFAEEIAKLFVVVLGLVVVPHNLPEQLVVNPGPSDRFTGCVRWWTTLVESPKALAMAGMAAGFGFMTCENLEYFFMVFTTLSYSEAAASAAFRVFLNLHPILTGLAAARLATEVFRANKQMTFGRIFRALYPSILLHALFDFGLMFSATNPDKDELDGVFVVVSMLLIPLSLILLILTYRKLDSRSTSALLVHNELTAV